jgi:hypothetical protein
METNGKLGTDEEQRTKGWNESPREVDNVKRMDAHLNGNSKITNEEEKPFGINVVGLSERG